MVVAWYVELFWASFGCEEICGAALHQQAAFGTQDCTAVVDDTHWLCRGSASHARINVCSLALENRAKGVRSPDGVNARDFSVHDTLTAVRERSVQPLLHDVKPLIHLGLVNRISIWVLADRTWQRNAGPRVAWLRSMVQSMPTGYRSWTIPRRLFVRVQHRTSSEPGNAFC